MTVTTIKVSIEVHGYGWIGWEASLSPDENPTESTHQLKKLVESCTSTDYSMMGTVKAEVKKDSPVDRSKGIEEAINCCTTLVALERFRPMIERENVDILYEAYTNKKKQLQSQ